MRFQRTISLGALATAAVTAAVTAALALGGACARDAEPPPARPAPAPPRPPRPTVVLLRHALWGAPDDDRPLFVLYDDGRALVPRWVDGAVQSYRTARVDLRDRDAALARLGIGPELLALAPAYALDPDSPARQEALVLCVWRGDTVTRVAVGVPPLTPLGRPRLPEATPRPFRDAYRALTTFRPADAVEWSPPAVEVTARPYEYAPDGPPLRWPAGWPGLADAARRVERVVADTVWTLALPYDHLADLRRLLRRRRTRQAIQIGTRKVAIAWRVAFPGEPLWRAQLARLDAALESRGGAPRAAPNAAP